MALEAQETLRRLKKVEKAEFDSRWFKNKQKDYRRFKEIWEFQRGSIRLMNVQ